MPPTTPRLRQVDNDALAEEEARLEGPTAVSTPVRDCSKDGSPDEAEKSRATKVVNSEVVGLQEDPPQSDAINDGEEPIIVTFNTPYDPDNPYDWSRFKKIRIAVLVLTYALVRLQYWVLPAVDKGL